MDNQIIFKSNEENIGISEQFKNLKSTVEKENKKLNKTFFENKWKETDNNTKKTVAKL